LEDLNMQEPAVTKLPVKTERMTTEMTRWPFVGLRREIDRLFDDFDPILWRSPFRRPIFGIEPFSQREPAWESAPAVDVAEDDKGYEITAELPGMDEKNIEVKVANGGLTIRGEKSEEKEEKKRNYYLHERRFGSFERSFAIPEGVDANKIEATFSKGVLKVMIPKTAEAQKAEKKIAVKAA
jgi:HSP20 family protein